jgi:hypothetical protein
MAPAVVVRADSYLPPPEIPAMGQTNVETWLGLSLDDEIAVLPRLPTGQRSPPHTTDADVGDDLGDRRLVRHGPGG